MKQTFFEDAPVKLEPCKYFSNDKSERQMILNDGFWAINEGEAEAQCLGGNLLTLNFMLGNRFASPIEDKILFVEENHIIDYKGVEKEIQEVLNRPDGDTIKGSLSAGSRGKPK